MESQKYLTKKFFFLTFSCSWLLWGAAILFGRDISQMPTPILFALAGAAPAMTAVYLTYSAKDKAQIRDFWDRAFNFRRPKVRWLFFSLILPPALVLISGFIDSLLGGRGFQLEARFQTNYSLLLTLAVFTLFFGPLPEELGWRGYALDGLQRRFSPLKSSLILGAVWTLWHLPLFFIPGSYQNSLAFGSPDFYLFLVDKLFQSILITWIFNKSSRSTLTAILFHFAVNFSGEMLNLDERGIMILTGFWFVCATVTSFALHFQSRSPTNKV